MNEVLTDAYYKPMGLVTIWWSIYYFREKNLQYKGHKNIVALNLPKISITKNDIFKKLQTNEYINNQLIF